MPVELIQIDEEIHLKTKIINLSKKIKRYKENEMIEKPIAVRKNGKSYILIAGLSCMCVAKLLGFKTIPVVIHESSHIEFILKYVI